MSECLLYAGMSRVLKELCSYTTEDDDSLTIIDKMAVAELLQKGQALDAILNCLKVCVCYP